MHPVANDFRSSFRRRRWAILVGAVIVICLGLLLVSVIHSHLHLARLPLLDRVVLFGLAAVLVAALALIWRAWWAVGADQALVERLEEGEAGLRLLTSQLPADVWTTDAELRLTSVSGALVPRLDIPRIRVAGSTLYEVFGTRDIAHPVIAAHLRALGGQTGRYERAAGSVILEGHVEPLRDVEGRVVGCVGVAVDVTERRASEQQGRLLAQALEGATDFISVTDAENRFLYVNEAFLRTYGYAREEVLGQTPALFGAEDSMRREILERTILGGWSGEVVNRRKDGSAMTVSLSTTPIRDAEGRSTGLLGVARDISERKQAQETAGRYRALVESSEDAIISLSPDGTIETWNAGAEHLYGYRGDEAIGRPYAMVVPPEDASELGIILEGLRRGHRIEHFETERLRKGGARISVSVTASPIRDDGGRVVGMSEIHRDITERRRAEAALLESEQRFRTVLDRMRLIGLGIDPSGHVTYCNEFLCELTGWRRDELIGSDYFGMLIPAGHPVVGVFRRAVETGDVPAHYENEIVTRDGRRRQILWNNTWLRDMTGRVSELITVGEDVTELMQSQEELRALARHLESVREEEHTRMAREIHDEVGQALTALRLDASWLARKLPEASAPVRQKVAGMIRLADDTIEAGRRIVAELRPPILDDLGLVPALEWHLEQFAKHAGLRFKLAVSPRRLTVDRDLAVTAYRIVQEALTNVARHAEAKTVHVRLAERDGALTLEIRDDGRGIPADAVANHRAFGLVGMRERAYGRGGSFTIGRGAEGGTTVRVVIPLERRQQARQPA
jgi:PAS domain S-box-containing protein